MRHPLWLLSKPASQAAAAAAAPTHPRQTVFLHVDPTDTVSMLKQKLQELLQKVGQLWGCTAVAGMWCGMPMGH